VRRREKRRKEKRRKEKSCGRSLFGVSLPEAPRLGEGSNYGRLAFLWSNPPEGGGTFGRGALCFSRITSSSNFSKANCKLQARKKLRATSHEV